MRDMTCGDARTHLIHFALPLLLGNWLQLAYNAVDSIIAGPVMNLVILAISGLCIGAGVLMSEAYGGKLFEKLRACMATTLLFGVALSIVIAGIGIILSPAILGWLAVPEKIREITNV